MTLTTMLILASVATIIYTAYNIFAVKCLKPKELKFQFPSSLSESFYLLKKYKPGWQWLFPVTMGAIIALLMPMWLELSEGSNWQFLSFLSCAGLMFVAASPAFKERTEGTIHSISAVICALCAVGWCVAFDTWYILLITLTLSLSGMGENKDIDGRTNIVYWLEQFAFYSLFASVITTIILRMTYII